MTARRTPGGPTGPRRGPNDESLDRLGSEIASGGRRPANEEGLLALGDAIDRRGGSTRGSTGRSNAPRGSRRRDRRRRRRRALTITGVVVLVLALIAGGGAFYLWHVVNQKLDALKTNSCGPHGIFCEPSTGNDPFNVLVIGSDSRAGLTSAVCRVTGCGSVAGQRSDVVKIFHVDPQKQTISVLSIPRDTVVTLLPFMRNTYGTYNRINVNYTSGTPGTLIRTIEANYGIRINHVVQVGFGGLINAVDALGGIYLNFPYPSTDPYSSLSIGRAGCQRLSGFKALATARSRHFYYNIKHNPVFPKDWMNLSYDQMTALGWVYDGTSDYGRIDRQDQVLRAMIEAARHDYNPDSLYNFVSALPQGLKIDNTFSNSELINLALTFRHFSPDALAAYTLPNVAGVSSSLGDVLYTEQPQAQQILVKIFGPIGSPGGLVQPTMPPPGPSGYPVTPPTWTVQSTTTTTAHATTSTAKPAGSGGKSTTSSTFAPIHSSAYYSFNPSACYL